MRGSEEGVDQKAWRVKGRQNGQVTKWLII